MDVLKILGRSTSLFNQDVLEYDEQLTNIINASSFLVLGGGGSIGQAVSKEIFKRNAKKLHVVDLSENYLVELVRDIRSKFGYTTKDFDTFCLDCGTSSFQKFIQKGAYDFILNLSAMKHVRSENNPYSMERMLEVNLINVLRTCDSALLAGTKKYFCVSTDKAANPANFMGATKRAMELCLMREDQEMDVSGARFANVAFSNGSLLEGFLNRIKKSQPLSLPVDVERFFISSEEAGIICLFSALLGANNQIFFPFNDLDVKLTNFKSIAVNLLRYLGKEAVECYDEGEARELMNKLDLEKYWPINLFQSDTAGEKPFEEFYMADENLCFDKFKELAFVEFKPQIKLHDVKKLLAQIEKIDPDMLDAREQYLRTMTDFVPSFDYIRSDRFLNGRM